jgi:hypothetical protein
MAGLILDHVLPIICLTIEFSINAIPFMRRHLFIILIITVIYLVINFLYVKMSGKLIYIIFKWRNITDFLLPAFLLVLGIIIFFSLEFISKIKIYYCS